MCAESSPGRSSILSGLRDREAWRAKEHVLDLQRKLSGMLSPFEEVDDFHVHLEVDGKTLVLAEIAKKVRQTALLKYVIKFDGQVLNISGRTRLKFFQPRGKDDEALFKSLCAKDSGRALYKFLTGRTGKGPTGALCAFGTRGMVRRVWNSALAG